MNFFSAMEIASSGLSAQRARMNALSSNLANARTTRNENGDGPYRRLDPVFRAVPVSQRFADMVNDPEAQNAYLVEVPEIREDQGPPQRVYEPSHPDADEDGYVELPNVNVVEEMVNMITASRAYESGVTVVQTLKSMARSAISISG
ncbi:MAG TPA: flagellar basal body rod protein FlgC [Sandaracinaceae bacterium LLY-WYZ-13_1]|nr:flagellar basal body rod protein FlgC [Sandaracinaceae bacterium LLY-WYZ-13_1]